MIHPVLEKYNKNIILILFIVMILFYDIILLEINSNYPHSLVLSNGNLIIVHEYGINLYNPSFTILIGQYNFTEENKITCEEETSATSIFQEEETENNYVFILAKNILYIFTPELVYKLSSDMSSYLISDLIGFECLIYYNFLFYKYQEQYYYFFIGYPKDGKLLLSYFQIDISSGTITNLHNLTYTDDSNQYIPKTGVTCQIMNVANENILTCFYKINYPKILKVVGFIINEDNNNIERNSNINISSSQIDKEQAIIKSAVSDDRKNALICYLTASYEDSCIYCVSFNIDSLSFGEENKYAEQCYDKPDQLNTYYFKENEEYFFVCKTKGSNGNYEIIKFDKNLNKIDIDNEEYNNEPNFNVDNCYYIYSFSLIYWPENNNYVIIGDSIVDGTTGVIRINSLPDYYNFNLSIFNFSLDYFSTSSIISSSSISSPISSSISSLSSNISSSISSIFSSSISSPISSSISSPSSIISSSISPIISSFIISPINRSSAISFSSYSSTSIFSSLPNSISTLQKSSSFSSLKAETYVVKRHSSSLIDYSSKIGDSSTLLYSSSIPISYSQISSNENISISSSTHLSIPSNLLYYLFITYIEIYLD